MEKLRMLYRAWRYRWKLDPDEIRLVRESLQPGDTAVDIGAHKGGYTYWMHRAVGPGGQVFSFEPQPALADYLRRMKAALRMENVHIQEAGLSAQAGIMTMSVPGGKPSPGGTLEAGLIQGNNVGKHQVKVLTLDGFLGSQKQGKVRFIKCDVEGHELDVFRGAEQTLRQHRPIVMFECEDRHHRRYTSRDVFAFLEGLGYAGHFFVQGKLVPLAEFRAETHGKFGGEDYVNNFIFQPK